MWLKGDEMVSKKNVPAATLLVHSGGISIHNKNIRLISLVSLPPLST